MKREFLMIVVFLAVALVTTEIIFTAPAQGRWVLLEALVNPNNEPLEFYGGEGGTPGWYDEPRYNGKFRIYTVSETSFTMEDREVDHEFEYWHVTLQSNLDKPPNELIPGETVNLNVNFSHSGTVTDGNPGVQFWYSGDGISMQPTTTFMYFPWHPDFDGISSTTYSFLVPETHSGEIEIYASWWNAPAALVVWKYQAEESTTTVSSTTTTTVLDTSTTTTAPGIVPELELTYPVGESPKVFTNGWVFGAQCTYTDEDGIEVDISDQVSWGGTGKFNPNKGSRSYPTFNLPNIEGQHTIELSVEINGEEYKKEFQVEAVPATNYARVADLARCPSDSHGCIACPHPTIGPIIAGSPNVSISGKPAARVGDPGIHAACCGANMYTITAGDENVLIDGMPAARKGDQTKHCGGDGRIIEGSGSPGAGSKVIKSDHHTCKIPTKAVPHADEGGTILGKVTDTVGTGIVGVGVTAYGDTNIDVWGTITDENGEYQITGLPDDNFNIHFWGGNWAYNDGYLSSWYNGKSSMDTADTVTITGPGSVSNIDVTLAAGGSISGTVKDSSGGGIEKATVGATGESGGTSFGYTDENGDYQIAGLEDDSYRVYCDTGSQGYISEWYNDKSSQNSADLVTVSAPNQTSGIDFTLSGSGGISGTVKDTSGNGIEEVYVKAFGESTSMTGMGATDENGAYEILGIPDDSYRVQFQGESQGYSDQWYSNKSNWDTAELVAVTAPNETTGINAELPPAGATTTTTTTPQQPCPIEEIYGEYSEEAELLRYFRDNVLNKTPEGQEIIRLYYVWSPAIVKAMEEDKQFKKEIKEIIDGVLVLTRRNH